MHTYKTESALFMHHGNVEGNVYIVPLRNGETMTDANGELVEIEIEAEDILKFVAYNHVLSNAIGELEAMDYKEILSLLKPRQSVSR